MIPALELENVTREFRPRRNSNPRIAVNDLNLTLESGSIFCLLGPNGAGKTTTIKMISTMLRPSEGTITVDGINAIAHPRRARARMGLMLGGERGFYLRASARDNLRFFADVVGLGRADINARVEECLDIVGLNGRADDPVSRYSTGMRQRLHIARSILGKPKLLLLDEPTNGIDPESAADVRKLIRKLSYEGVAVFLTTHHLVEAEQLATSFGLMVGGHLILQGGVADIALASGVQFVSTASTHLPLIGPIIQQIGSANIGAMTFESRAGITHFHLTWNSEPDIHKLEDIFRNAIGLVPEDLYTRKATLEEVYLALVQSRSTP